MNPTIDLAPVNPRVTNYCLAADLTLAEACKEIWKYSMWIQGQWSEWRKEKNIKDRWHAATDAQQVEFDEWLTRRVVNGLAA